MDVLQCCGRGVVDLARHVERVGVAEVGLERAERGPLVNAQVWQLTLDDVRSKRDKLEPVAYERDREKHYSEDPEEAEAEKKDGPKSAEPDPIRNETLRIIEDLIALTNQNKTASVNGNPASVNGN